MKQNLKNLAGASLLVPISIMSPGNASGNASGYHFSFKDEAPARKHSNNGSSIRESSIALLAEGFTEIQKEIKATQMETTALVKKIKDGCPAP